MTVCKCYFGTGPKGAAREGRIGVTKDAISGQNPFARQKQGVNSLQQEVCALKLQNASKKPKLEFIPVTFFVTGRTFIVGEMTSEVNAPT